MGLYQAIIKLKKTGTAMTASPKSIAGSARDLAGLDDRPSPARGCVRRRPERGFLSLALPAVRTEKKTPRGLGCDGGA